MNRNDHMVDIICIHKYKWYISIDYRFVVITFLSWSLRQLLDNISNTNYKTRHCFFLLPPPPKIIITEILWVSVQGSVVGERKHLAARIATKTLNELRTIRKNMYVHILFPKLLMVLMIHCDNKTNQRTTLVDVNNSMALVTDHLPETNNEFQPWSISLLCRHFVYFFTLHNAT